MYFFFSTFFLILDKNRIMKLTFIHYIFHDKDNYHKDDNLKQRWDIYKHILGVISKESPPLLKDKFIYFLKFKKLTTLKRLFIGLIFLSFIYKILSKENNDIFSVVVVHLWCK